MDEDNSAEQKTWHVYIFGKRNINKSSLLGDEKGRRDVRIFASTGGFVGDYAVVYIYNMSTDK